MEIVIPENTTATVFVPAGENMPVWESGVPAGLSRGVRFLGNRDGAAVFAVGSGSYRFESMM
jgi:alpha-L-rhamnosidase